MNVKSAIQFSIGPLLSAALGFITIPIVSWGFESEDVGRLTMLQVMMSLGITVFSVAMHQAYVREYYEVENKPLLLKTALIPGLLFLAVTIIVTAILPISPSKILFDLDSSFITSFLYIGIACNLIVNILMHVIRMEQRGLAFSASQALPKLLMFAFVLLIFSSDMMRNFENLLAANTFSFILTLSALLILTCDSWIKQSLKDFDSLLLKRMLKFSLPLVVGSMAYWGLTSMDRFFIKAILGLDALGIYAVAVAMASAATVLSMVFSNLWHPVVYKWAQTEVDTKKVQMVVDGVFLLVVTIWSLAGLLSWILPVFFPSVFKPIEFLVVACVAMPLFYMLSEATVVGIGIMKKSAFSMAASILAFLINAALNYVLIPLFGIAGAAIASLIAFFIFFVVRTESSCYVWKKIARIKIYLILILYSITTIFFVIREAEDSEFYFVWSAFLIITYSVYFGRIKQFFMYTKASELG